MWDSSSEGAIKWGQAKQNYSDKTEWCVVIKYPFMSHIFAENFRFQIPNHRQRLTEWGEELTWHDIIVYANACISSSHHHHQPRSCRVRLCVWLPGKGDKVTSNLAPIFLTTTMRSANLSWDQLQQSFVLKYVAFMCMRFSENAAAYLDNFISLL